MPRYVNEKFQDKKFYLDSNEHGVYTLKEYRRGIKAAEMTMTKEQASSLMKRMIENGWQEV